MNRGSKTCTERCSRRSAGFNEAPIHESGKSQRARYRYVYAHCFNEAPIHESGKCERTERERESEKSASMRPRFMNRGSLDYVPNTRHTETGLQ